MKRIKDIDDLNSALEDAKYYIQNAQDFADGLKDVEDAPDATPAVLDALAIGLKAIEFKFGFASVEAAEVRKFMEALK